ncbi:MAG: hypothetical protein ACRD2L_25370 [Terriglobia bacterium]
MKTEGTGSIAEFFAAELEYQEHHFEPQGDVGVAWNNNRLWVCLDGAALFRAKVIDGKLFVSFTPPPERT